MLNHGFETPADWVMNQAQASEELVKDLDQYIMASLLTELKELRQRHNMKDEASQRELDIPDSEGGIGEEKEEYFESYPQDERPPIEEIRSVSLWERFFWFFMLWICALPLAVITAPLFVAWQPVPIFFKCGQAPLNILTSITMFPTRCAENMTGRQRSE